MTIRAVLNGVDVHEVLEMLAQRKKSGELCLRGAGRDARLTLLRGGIVAKEAQDDVDPVERVAQRLMEFTEAGIDEMEFAPAGPGEDAAQPEGSRRVPVHEVTGQLAKLAQEWARIREAIPTMESVLCLSKQPIAHGQRMTLDPEEWAVVFALAQPRSAREVCREVDKDALPTMRLLVAMLVKGLVELTAVQPTMAETAVSAGQADVPADLLVHGVKDVLAEVTSEMTGISKEHAMKNIETGSLADEDGEIPAEWQAYMTRLDLTPRSGTNES